MRAAVSNRIAPALLSLLASLPAKAQVHPPADAAGSTSRVTSDAQPAPPDPSTYASAAELLSLGEQAMTEIDYVRARQLATAAVARGELEPASLARAYRLIAVSSAQLRDDATAEAAFVRLFALEPSGMVETRLAPARRTAVLHARGFWAQRQPFGIDVNYLRRERRIVVRVHDPLTWSRNLHVWYRFGERGYVRLQEASAAEIVFEVSGAKLTEALEVYAFATDEHGNVITEFGRERTPRLFGLSADELDEFLRRDVRGGQPGSYALRLEELDVDVGVHGYLSVELSPVEDQPSFDLHHAAAMLRASYQEAASLELAVSWEHLAREDGDFYLPHAFVDLQFAEGFVVRAGWFEVPVGAFNEYLYPDLLRITGLAPLFAGAIVPALWSEVGLQLRGRAAFPETTHLTYAVFVVNGLEQRDGQAGDGDVAEGGDIRAMRFNARDRWSADKAFGGRLGLEVGAFDFGVSGYTGRYTIEENRRLSIGDVDASYRGEFVTIRSEAALAWQETTDEVLRKFGLYVLVAMRPIAHLEPYAQYDYTHVAESLQRALLGIAVYPFPRDRGTRQLRLKSEAGFEFPEDRERVFVWLFQLTTGF